MPAAVRTEALTKDYGSGRGVFGLDLEVREGEILGFLGPNGAGKSTTMRMLLGLSKPTAGRAEVLGRDVLSARARVGYLAGDFELYESSRAPPCSPTSRACAATCRTTASASSPSASGPTCTARCACSRPATARRSG